VRCATVAAAAPPPSPITANPAQKNGAAICAGWAFGATFIVFKVVNAVKSMRVSKEVELEGLDVPEFGMQGYPEDAISVTVS